SIRPPCSTTKIRSRSPGGAVRYVGAVKRPTRASSGSPGAPAPPRANATARARARAATAARKASSVRLTATRMPTMAGPLRQLAECDHADEDQSDDQHPRDDLLALLGGVDLHFLLRLSKENSYRRDRRAGATPPVAEPAGMDVEGPVDGLVARTSSRERLECGGVAVSAQRLTSLCEPALPEQRGRRRPRGPGPPAT